jgi:chromosome segregation ATPase
MGEYEKLVTELRNATGNIRETATQSDAADAIESLEARERELTTLINKNASVAVELDTKLQAAEKELAQWRERLEEGHIGIVSGVVRGAIHILVDAIQDKLVGKRVRILVEE